jgi:hypothetical protein
MTILYVARSAKLGRWSSDVGLGKHIYKLGVADGEDPKALADRGWAGETDWKIVRQEPIEGLSEEDAIERLGRKERMVDPNIYPKIKGARGVFRVAADHVENHITVSRALAGESDRSEQKLKPADFAAYLMNNAKR